MFVKPRVLFFFVILILVIAGFIFYSHQFGFSNLKVYYGSTEVRITVDGFVPQEIYIRRGTRIRFVNHDILWHWPASDLHPIHNLYPEFDPQRAFGPNEEWSFVFERVGEWGYHDHLAPYILGKIVVVE